MSKDNPDCNEDETETCPWDSLDARCGRQVQGLCLNVREPRTELLATLLNWRGWVVLWMVLGQNDKALITCQIHHTAAVGTGRRLGRFPRLNGVQVGERNACSGDMSRWGSHGHSSLLPAW